MLRATSRATNGIFNVTYISNQLSFENMDAEQFDRLITELQALRVEIQRFNDRFELVSQKPVTAWINVMDLSRPASR
jgi:hypothetical protein